MLSTEFNKILTKQLLPVELDKLSVPNVNVNCSDEYAVLSITLSPLVYATPALPFPPAPVSVSYTHLRAHET